MAGKKFTAFDFGADNIKLCEIEQVSKVRVRITNFAKLNLPMLSLPGAEISKEKVIDWDKLTSDLMKIIKEKNISLDNVIISPQGRDVNTYVLCLPSVKRSDLKLIVEREIQKMIAIPQDHLSMMSFFKMDERITDNRKLLDVLVAIAFQEKMAAYINFSLNTNMRIKLISIKALALYQLMRRFYPLEDNIAILDIGSDVTTIVIVKNGKLKFARSIYTALKELRIALINKLNLADSEALPLIEKYGFALEENISSEEFQRYQKVILPLRERLTAEVHRSLLYYQERMGIKEKINHIYICGDGASLKMVEESLQTRLGIEVKLISSPEEIEISPQIEKDFKEKFPIFASSLGLAALSFEKEVINLLPKKEKAKVGKKVYIVLIILLLANLYLLSSNYRQQRRKVVTSRSNLNQLINKVKSFPQDLEKTYKSVTDKKKIFQGTLDLFSSIQTPQPDWQELLFTLARALDPKILVTDMKVKYQDGNWEFTINGIFSGTYPEAQFTLRKTRLKFEETGYFKDVNFELEKKEAVKLSEKADFPFMLKAILNEAKLSKRQL